MNANTKKINEMNDNELNAKFGVFGFSFSNGKPNFFEPAKFITNVKQMASNPEYIASLDKEEVFSILGWVQEFLGKNNFNGFNIDALRDFYCLMKKFYLSGYPGYDNAIYSKPKPGEFTIKDLANLFRDLYLDMKELDLTDIKTTAEVFINKIKSSGDPKLRHNDVGLFSLMCENSMSKIIKEEAFDIFKNYALANDKIDADLALIMICNVRDDLDAENSFIDKLEINDKDGKVNPEYLKTVNDWNINSYSWYYLSDQPFGKKDEFEREVEKGALFEKLICKLVKLGCENLLAEDVVPSNRASYPRKYRKLVTKAIEAAENKKIEPDKKDNTQEIKIVNLDSIVSDISDLQKNKLIGYTVVQPENLDSKEVKCWHDKYNALKQKYENIDCLSDKTKKSIKKLFDSNEGFWLQINTSICGIDTKSYYEIECSQKMSHLEEEIKYILDENNEFEKEIPVTGLTQKQIINKNEETKNSCIDHLNDLKMQYVGELVNMHKINPGEDVLTCKKFIDSCIDYIKSIKTDSLRPSVYRKELDIKTSQARYFIEYFASGKDPYFKTALDYYDFLCSLMKKYVDRVIAEEKEGFMKLISDSANRFNKISDNMRGKSDKSSYKAEVDEEIKHLKLKVIQNDFAYWIKGALEIHNYSPIKELIEKESLRINEIKIDENDSELDSYKADVSLLKAEISNVVTDTLFETFAFHLDVCTEKNTKKLKAYLGVATDNDKKNYIKSLYLEIIWSFENCDLRTVKNKLVNTVEIVYVLDKLSDEEKQFFIEKIESKNNITELRKIFEAISNNHCFAGLEAEKNMYGLKSNIKNNLDDSVGLAETKDKNNRNDIEDKDSVENLDDSVASVSTQDSIELNDSNNILNGFDILIYSQENTKALNSYLDKLNDEEKRDFLANQLDKVGEAFDSNESLESIKNKLLNIAFIIYGLGGITLKKGEKLTEHPILREINEANNIEDLKLMFEAFNSDYGLGIDRFNFYRCSKKNTEVLENYLKKADDEQKIKLVAKMLNETEKSFKDNNKTLDAIKNELLNAIEVIYKLNSLPKEIGKSKQFLINQVNEASEIGVFELIGLALKNIVSLILGKTSLEKEESRLQKAKFQNVFGMIRDAKAETEKPKSDKDKSTSRSK